MRTPKPTLDHAKLDRIVAEARRSAEQRDRGYREQALKMYPWICGRCTREFTGANLQELTVHHRNHNHDHNPADGSNWELLCVYCHDNEHSRYIDTVPAAPRRYVPAASARTRRCFRALTHSAVMDRHRGDVAAAQQTQRR